MNEDDLVYSKLIFATSVAGFAELRNTKSLLSLKERTVLTLIDGACPVSGYLPYLSAFEPVIEKMKKLEKLGYLRRAV